jgi:hypothetical protein
VTVVDEAFIGRWVARLREEVPDAVAILLGGSRLRGDAGPYSDVDFDVVVAEGPREDWPSWFDGEVRISTWIRDADSLAAAAEPQGWAFFLPTLDAARVCWVADDKWRARIADRPEVSPAGPPEVDHFEADIGKVANARHAGDDLGLRLAAQDLAHAVISVLAPLNPGPPAGSRRAALAAVLAFKTAPAGFGEDITACLGLGPGRDVYAAAGRLARGVADLLLTHADAFDDLVPAYERTRLRDGSLPAYARDLLG